MIQNVTIQASDRLTILGLQNWLERGKTTLESSVASDILRKITHLTDALKLQMALHPLLLPERYDTSEEISLHKQTFLILADHYKQFVLPEQKI